jgi:imidazoleglycerol-phosphate dehydratase/histidinol-phosphatase
LGASEISATIDELRKDVIVLESPEWKDVYNFLKLPPRKVIHERNTNETKITVEVNLDGSGKANNKNGLPFFDHMLDQLGTSREYGFDRGMSGDLHIDEHHSIEDTGIALEKLY